MKVKLTPRYERILRKAVNLNRPVYFLDFCMERAPDGALFALYRKGLLKFDFSHGNDHHFSWFVPTEDGLKLVIEADKRQKNTG